MGRCIDTHIYRYLIAKPINPLCRFSIFFCGCKQPKSIHKSFKISIWLQSYEFIIN